MPVYTSTADLLQSNVGFTIVDRGISLSVKRTVGAANQYWTRREDVLLSGADMYARPLGLSSAYGLRQVYGMWDYVTSVAVRVTAANTSTPTTANRTGIALGDGPLGAGFTVGTFPADVSAGNYIWLGARHDTVHPFELIIGRPDGVTTVHVLNVNGMFTADAVFREIRFVHLPGVAVRAYVDGRMVKEERRQSRIPMCFDPAYSLSTRGAQMHCCTGTVGTETNESYFSHFCVKRESDCGRFEL